MELIWVSLLLAVLVAQANAQAKTTTPKPFPCNKGKFKEVVLNGCCDNPMGVLAAPEYLAPCQTCTGVKDAETMEWISYWKMNLLMGADNKTDLNTKENKAILCKVAPFINCLFKEYKMQARDLFFGEEASMVINKTNPNRHQNYHYVMNEMLTDTTEYYQWGMIPPMFNGTYECPIPGKKTTKSVYLGNLYLTQYYAAFLVMMCPQPAMDPATNPGCAYKWNRFFDCSSDFENGIWSGQTAPLPPHLDQLRTQVLKKTAQLQAKYRQSLREL